METADDLARTIIQLNPDNRQRIIVAAGPPCPDYSRISDGDGRLGEHGVFCELLGLSGVQAARPPPRHPCGERLHGLLRGHSPLLAAAADRCCFGDAADFGLVSQVVQAGAGASAAHPRASRTFRSSSCRASVSPKRSSRARSFGLASRRPPPPTPRSTGAPDSAGLRPTAASLRGITRTSPWFAILIRPS